MEASTVEEAGSRSRYGSKSRRYDVCRIFGVLTCGRIFGVMTRGSLFGVLTGGCLFGVVTCGVF